MARDGAASRRAVRRVSSPDASGRPVRTVSPSQIALRDGGARARRLVARRRGGALLTGLHTDMCTEAREKKTPKMALRARRAENKKAHTGVAVWAFTLSRYRAGGLLIKVDDMKVLYAASPLALPSAMQALGKAAFAALSPRLSTVAGSACRPRYSRSHPAGRLPLLGPQQTCRRCAMRTAAGDARAELSDEVPETQTPRNLFPLKP